MTKQALTFRRIGGPCTARAAGVAGALLCAAAALGADTSRADVKTMLMLDDRLDLRPVEVAGLGRQLIHEPDARGQVRPRTLAGVLGLVPSSWDGGSEGDRGEGAEARAGRSWVSLVDGQRIVGRPDESGSREDGLAWRHDMLGAMAFRMERIVRIVFDGRAGAGDAPEPSGADDVVVLRNGDRIRGFVARVQPDVAIEADGATLTIPIDRVSRVDLVNERVRARGTHLWLTDGTRIGVHSFDETEGGEGVAVHLEAPSESPLSEGRSIPLHRLSAVAFEAGRIVPLTDLALRMHAPDPERRAGEAPVMQRGPADALGAGDVLMPGPMTAEWLLPARALRLAGWVTLPEPARLWGDCRVTFETVDASGAAAEVAAVQVHGAAPTVRLNARLGEGAVRLRVRIEPGAYGAVQDRVVLERFIVLTEALGQDG